MVSAISVTVMLNIIWNLLCWIWFGSRMRTRPMHVLCAARVLYFWEQKPHPTHWNIIYVIESMTKCDECLSVCRNVFRFGILAFWHIHIQPEGPCTLRIQVISPGPNLPSSLYCRRDRIGKHCGHHRYMRRTVYFNDWQVFCSDTGKVQSIYR